jgi:hypothetical protein
MRVSSSKKGRRIEKPKYGCENVIARDWACERWAKTGRNI